jgi:hypothetical protein
VRGITYPDLVTRSLHRLLTKCRCCRLNKECQLSSAVRKRRIVKSMPPTKTTRLEEKLDGLVSLLQSATQSLPVGASNIVATTYPQLSPESQQSAHSDPRDDRRNYSEPIHHPPGPMVATSNIPLKTVSRNLPMAYIPHDFKPSLAEADKRLRTFRTYKLKHFPFLTLSESVTSQELRQERPFLWFCIMAVSSNSSVQLMTLGREIRSILGRQVLLEGERTLD